MHCPYCHHIDTKVTDSRLVVENNQVRRRRECLQCEARFTTYERAELEMPRVLKQNGVYEPFKEEKLRTGMERSLEKRPVTPDQIDQAIDRIEAKIRTNGEREIRAQQIGEMVMEELRMLDEVAYVRFASVYRRFQDLNAFHEEISRLHNEDIKKGNDKNISVVIADLAETSE